MYVSAMVEEVRSRLRADPNDFTHNDVVRALHYPLQETARRLRCTLQFTSFTLTANQPELSLSSATHLRTSSIELVEVTPNNRGTWATATSYAKWDAVTGDGSPDNKLYECLLAHTSSGSNEPPNATYWRQLRWLRGYPLEDVGYSRITHLLRDDYPVAIDPYIDGAAYALAGQPKCWGAVSPTAIALWPVPADARTVRVSWFEPLLMIRADSTRIPWLHDEPNLVTTNIPERFLGPTLQFGAPALLASSGRVEELPRNGLWQQFDRALDELRGESDRVGPLILTDPWRVGPTDWRF
jgi:hypothetical protein